MATTDEERAREIADDHHEPGSSNANTLFREITDALAAVRRETVEKCLKCCDNFFIAARAEPMMPGGIVLAIKHGIKSAFPDAKPTVDELCKSAAQRIVESWPDWKQDISKRVLGPPAIGAAGAKPEGKADCSESPNSSPKTKRVQFVFDERSLESVEKLKEQGMYDATTELQQAMADADHDNRVLADARKRFDAALAEWRELDGCITPQFDAVSGRATKPCGECAACETMMLARELGIVTEPRP